MSKNKNRNGTPRQQNAPQDHKQPEKKPQTNKIRTGTGFEFEIKMKNPTDMRFVDALVGMDDESQPENLRLVDMIRVIRMLMGDAQKDAFFDHVAKAYGWASPGAVGKELRDIFASLDQSKKK